MPKGKFEVQQKQLDELPQQRPLILYITAPVHAKDHTLSTSNNKLFKPDPALPNGVRRRDAKPHNLCLVEAEWKLEDLETRVRAALDHHRDAAHKVVVVNAHGEREGLLLRDEGEERVLLEGRRLAEMLTPHTHGRHLHVVVFAAHGHVFAEQFYNFVQGAECNTPEAREVMAITHFTSEATPTSWAMVTTAGNGHVEVTRELAEFVKSHVEPNSPYKILDAKVKASCTIL